MTARATDPATSHLAATYISGKRPGLKDAFLMALKALGPSTANEIAQWCVQSGVGANAESVRKRALELVRDGLANYGPSRTCKVTGQQAGTLELSNGNPPDTNDQPQHANADGRKSVGDPQRNRDAKGNCQTVPSQPYDCKQNQGGQETVLTLEAERIAAAAEFLKNERELVAIFHVAVELSSLAKIGTWPVGTSNEYIDAIEKAALKGLIERVDQRVRRCTPKIEKKIVQKGLFGDE